MYSPAVGTVTSEYGYRAALSSSIGAMLHAGIDIANSVGTPIYAAFGGTVVKAGWGVVSGRTGNGILIRNTDGAYQYYGHLSSISVSVGSTVSEGQVIGLMGRTGRTTGSHLHFETWKAGNSATDTFNPRILFNRYSITPGSAGKATTTSNVSAVVKTYQGYLAATKHYTGALDGINGAMTIAAVKLFQSDYSLVVDGVWGTQTDTKAKEVLAMRSPTLSGDGAEGPLTVAAEQWALIAANVYTGRVDGNRGPLVKTAEQTFLQKGGFYTGAIDGDFGVYSTKAEQTFLQQQGFYLDGVVDGSRGPLTITAIQKCLNAKKFVIVQKKTTTTTTTNTETKKTETKKTETTVVSQAVETPISFVKTPDGKVYKAHNYAGTYWHVPNQPTYTAIKELLTSMKIPFSTEKSIEADALPTYGVEIK